MPIYEVSTYETWVRTQRVEATSSEEAETIVNGLNPVILSDEFEYVDTDSVEVEEVE